MRFQDFVQVWILNWIFKSISFVCNARLQSMFFHIKIQLLYNTLSDYVIKMQFEQQQLQKLIIRSSVSDSMRSLRIFFENSPLYYQMVFWNDFFSRFLKRLRKEKSILRAPFALRICRFCIIACFVISLMKCELTVPGWVQVRLGLRLSTGLTNSDIR